jgi:glycosyltransferase involved in cell wall biosynthesis
MRILTIDALPLMGQGGISNYNRPLFEALIAQADLQWKVELIFRLGFLGSRKNIYRNYIKQLNGSNVSIRTSSLPDRFLANRWERQFNSKSDSAGNNKNVFLATTDLVPRCKNAAVGWIVYDITPIIIPEFFNCDPDDYYLTMRNRLARTDFLIAISKRTKLDIIEKFNYPENKIAVIYPGATFSTAKAAAIPYHHKRPYICYLGALAKNKNVDGMVRIFARCVHERKIDYDMVLTGKDFCGKAFWDQLLNELRIADRVSIRGWVAEEERDAILANATMLWNFSWYEGFGLPVLEAAAKGIPVLYTNRGAVPEILCSKVQEIDPANEDEAVNKAAAVLSSENTLSKWSQTSLTRAAKFSWKNSTSHLLEWLEDRISATDESN